MSKRFATVLISACLLLIPAQVSAHEFIRDDNGKETVVLHIDPEDDPVAGQTSTLSFDLQNVQPETAVLHVTTADGKTVELAAYVKGPVVSSQYTFAAQGVYRLHLLVHSGDRTYGFGYTQRVSRGAAEKPLWAEVLFYGGAAGAIATIAAAWRRRGNF
jgi:hypothetical protein